MPLVITEQAVTTAGKMAQINENNLKSYFYIECNNTTAWIDVQQCSSWTEQLMPFVVTTLYKDLNFQMPLLH